MKIIEKVIKYDDYNYVEGTLQFKAYGRTTKRLANSEFFSIDYISDVRLLVEKKYLAPDLPSGINKNKVSALSLPEEITTIVDGDENNPYSIAFDEIIVDDDFLDDNLNIIGRRFFTVKDGPQISSTVEIKVYGLIKIPQQYIEKIILYEVFTIAHGRGEIVVSPKKEGYVKGERVKIQAVPDANQNFLHWGDNLVEDNKEFEIEIDENDLYIEGFFTDLIPDIISDPSSIPGNRPNLLPTRKTILKTAKKFTEKTKDVWHQPIPTSEKFGIENSGCGELFGWGIVLVFFGFIILLLISLFGKPFLILVGIALLLYLLSLIPARIFSWRVFKWLFVLGLVFIIIKGLMNFTDSFKSYKKERTEKIAPIPVSEELINENETVDYIHVIRWQDYSAKWYETKLIINSDIVENAEYYRNNQPILQSTSDYNNLLSNLYNKSRRDAYYKVEEKLDSIKTANNLDARQYAEIIVSMVQSIPYYAIVPESCNPFTYRDPMIRDLLMNNPCQPYIRHGIKAPAEFLKDLKGDCDTRTLFLYGLLKAKGFDVAIFGSQKYGHSLLGISLPLNGIHYKTINNKQYYLWEVTAKDFKPGILPPTISDLRYWEVNLN